MQVSGTSVPYDKPDVWRLASISSRGSKELTVFAVGSEDRGGGACGPPVIRTTAAESATEVRVLVAAYQQPSRDAMACPAIGYIASPHLLVLQQPLGERRLVEASTGATRSVLDGSRYPDVSQPPSSFGRPTLQRQQDRQSVERVWSGSDGTSLRLETMPPAAVREFGPYGRIVRQFTIDGVPATIYQAPGGRYGQIAVQWTPNPKQTITLSLSNTPKRQWNADQAESVARSVTGYHVAPTGRLPQPSTPGTAAAVYNSADGPVRHAENLLKSSGVYLGVSCQGAGEVDIALRGTAYIFDCTGTMSHEVRRSTGKPFQEFFLDVDASPGVRWAITLARASLDGT